jgi:hypothetical protein
MYRLSNTAATSAAAAVTSSASMAAGVVPGLSTLLHPSSSSGITPGGDPPPPPPVLKSSADFGINVTDSQLQHVMSAPQHATPGDLSSFTVASSVFAVGGMMNSTRVKDGGESASSHSAVTNTSSASRPPPRRASSRGKVKSGHADNTAHTAGTMAVPHSKVTATERTKLSNPPYYSHPLTAAQVHYGDSSHQKSSSNSGSRDSGGSTAGSGGTSRESYSNFDSTTGGNFSERGSENKNNINSERLPLSGSSSSTVNLLLRNASNASINSIISVSSELKFSTNASDIVISDDVFGDMTFDEDLLYPMTD